jgi:uncharacterized protein YggE
MRSLHVAPLILLLAAYSQVHAEQTIAVTGDAEIKIVPDQVVLFLGVEARTKTLAETRGENDRRVASVRDAVKRMGIADGDFQTDFIQLGIDYENDAVTPRSYWARKSMVVIVRKIDQMEQVLSAALDAGATHIHGVDFQTTKLREFRDQARAMAVKAATEKARDMAAAAGVKLSPGPISISGWQFGGQSWYGSGWGMGSRGYMSQNIVNAGIGSETQGTVALGRISVTATVSLQYRIE